MRARRADEADGSGGSVCAQDGTAPSARSAIGTAVAVACASSPRGGSRALPAARRARAEPAGRRGRRRPRRPASRAPGDGGVSTHVTKRDSAARSFPRTSAIVERMCALLTSCDKLPIPRSLVPDDFASCVKKMSDEMSSATAGQLLADAARVRAPVGLVRRPALVRDARRERRGVHRARQAGRRRLLRRRRPRAHVLARAGAGRARLPARRRAVHRRRRRGDLHARPVRHRRRGRQAAVLGLGHAPPALREGQAREPGLRRLRPQVRGRAPTAPPDAPRAGRRAPRGPGAATATCPSAATTATRCASTARRRAWRATRASGGATPVGACVVARVATGRHVRPGRQGQVRGRQHQVLRRRAAALVLVQGAWASAAATPRRTGFAAFRRLEPRSGSSRRSGQPRARADGL